MNLSMKRSKELFPKTLTFYQYYLAIRNIADLGWKLIAHSPLVAF
jgi:hypothetical protein